MSEEKPRPGRQIPLPIEERLRGVRALLRAKVTSPPIGWLRRLWADHFSDNPLLPRETGTLRGPAKWRAPMLWAFIVAALPEVSQVLYMASEVRVYQRLQGVDDLQLWQDELFRFFTGPISVGLMWSGELIRLGAGGVLAWLVAHAWARERDPSLRDQIGASPLTVRQLIGAKTLIWVLPWLIFFGVGVVISYVDFAAKAILAPPPLRPWFGRIDLIGRPLWWSVSSYILSDLFWLAKSTVDRVIQLLMIVGVSTRLTLVWYRLALSVVLTFACWVGVQAIEIGLQFLTNALRWFWFFPFVHWLHSALYLAVAIAVWWGLPRAVARVYGMRA